MFRIPDYFKMNMPLEDAWKTIQGLGKGDALAGMEFLADEWDAYARGDQDDCYDGDSDWFENWIYEANAYNVVFEGMSKLFAPKETV